jgi:hypothetical protein
MLEQSSIDLFDFFAQVLQIRSGRHAGYYAENPPPFQPSLTFSLGKG